MTVYSAALHQKTTISEKVAVISPRLLKFNIFIFTVFVLLLVTHIVVANRLVAKRFELANDQQVFHAISSKLATQEVSITRGQDMENLIALVKNNGMIASKDGQTLFITTNVALLP